jgi:hypothetical protein
MVGDSIEHRLFEVEIALKRIALKKRPDLDYQYDIFTSFARLGVKNTKEAVRNRPPIRYNCK